MRAKTLRSMILSSHVEVVRLAMRRITPLKIARAMRSPIQATMTSRIGKPTSAIQLSGM